MATLTFLGSGAAVPTVGHDNTYLALEGTQSTLLIDCAGSPLLKLQLAGIEPSRLEYVILTHRHPDHLYGFPALMLGLWLLGCRTPLHVFGEAETLRAAQVLLDVFHPFEEWPGFCPPAYHEVQLIEHSLILDLPDLLITASPATHLVPGLMLKILNKISGRSIVYSGDTAPCDNLIRLAHGADVLIHEASGEYMGHSSAAQAGKAAQRAGVKKLYLIHYPTLTADLNALLAQARQEFAGEVELARDFGVCEF
ncbi:MAG: MBL fold metallo-hydrolase [Anaerolineae bacterium]